MTNDVKLTALATIPSELHPWVVVDKATVRTEGKHTFAGAEGWDAAALEGRVLIGGKGSLFALEGESRKHRGLCFARKVTPAEAAKHISKYYGAYIGGIDQDTRDEFGM